MPTVDNFKTQLRELLSEHSSGISKADLPRLWLEKFGTAFSPVSFGQHTLNQLLCRDELKDALRIKGDVIRQVFSLQVVEGFLQRSRKQLCTNQKHVTISVVIQDTCKQLGVDRWDDLGVGAQHHIRALRTLMDLERKIDTHISSYVAARYRGTATLYELEQMICAAEGVVKYEELQMGPILKHPMVERTFHPAATVTQVPKVTVADICESVWEALMEKPRAEVRETLKAEEVLQHLMGAKKVSSPFELCVTIGPVGFIIKQVAAAKREQSSAISSYSRTLKKQLDAELQKHMEDERQRLQAEHSAALEAKKAALAERLRNAAAAKLDALEADQKLQVAAAAKRAAPETAQQLQEGGVVDAQDALQRGQRAVLSAMAGMRAEGLAMQGSLATATEASRLVPLNVPCWDDIPLGPLAKAFLASRGLTDPPCPPAAFIAALDKHWRAAQAAFRGQQPRSSKAMKAAAYKAMRGMQALDHKVISSMAPKATHKAVVKSVPGALVLDALFELVLDPSLAGLKDAACCVGVRLLLRGRRQAQSSGARM